MMHEVAWMGRAPMALEIGRSGNEIAVDIAEPPRPQRGIGQRRDAQGGIEAGADQIDHLVAQMQIDRDIRIFGQKLRQERRHLPEAEGHRARRGARARAGSPTGRGPRFRRPRLRPGCARRDRAGSCPASVSASRREVRLNSLRAEPLLQPGDGLGHGGLGQVEILGGSRKRAELGHLGEDREPFEIGEFGHRLETMSFQSFYLFTDPAPHFGVMQQRRAWRGG